MAEQPQAPAAPSAAPAAPAPAAAPAAAPVSAAPVAPAPASAAPAAPQSSAAVPVTAEPPQAGATPPAASYSPAEAVPPPASAEGAAAAPQTAAAPPSEKAPSSLLGDAGRAAAEPPKPAEPPKAEAKPPEAPAEPEPLKYEPFKFPEGVSPDPENFGKISDVFARNRVPQEVVQQVLDLAAAQRLKEAQAAQTQWKETNDAWVTATKSDPEIGGNRWNTTLSRCGAVLEQYGHVFGREREAALRDMLGITGMGNFVEMARFINWAAGHMTERSRAVPAITPKPPQAQGRAQTRYRNSLPMNGAA